MLALVVFAGGVIFTPTAEFAAAAAPFTMPLELERCARSARTCERDLIRTIVHQAKKKGAYIGERSTDIAMTCLRRASKSKANMTTNLCSEIWRDLFVPKKIG